MKLELEPATATAGLIKGKRRFERGEMTIGRDPSCALVINDETRMVSKTHCRILRDGIGFALRDESANGVSLSGRELAGGETVRLADGDEISLCGYVLRVRITNAEEPDWSDPDSRLAISEEPPSISTILADVAPTGRSASGILPGRLAENWMEAESRVGRRDQVERLSHTEIGWRGPPPVSMLGALLPNDWDDNSDAGSRNEHVAAMGIRMRLPQVVASQADEPATPPQQEPGGEALLNAFLQGYGAALEPADDPRLFMHRMGHVLRELVEHSNRMTAQIRDFALGEGVEWSAGAIDPLDSRCGIEAAEHDHRRVLEALRWLLDETDRLAPAIVAARPAPPQPAAATLRERLRETVTMLGQEGRAWRNYRAAYFVDDASPRVRFAARLAAAENLTGNLGAFEELKPDNTRQGAAG